MMKIYFLVFSPLILLLDSISKDKKISYNFGFCYLYLIGMIILLFELFSSESSKFLSSYIGVDTLSLSLLILSMWVSVLMVLSSSSIFLKNVSSNLFLLLTTMLLLSLLASFMSMNLMMFYFFFEFSLIPTLLLVMGWGYQPERIQAGIYFLFYTLSASLPLLLALIYIYNEWSTLFYLFLVPLMKLNFLSYFLLFCLTMAFLVKMPLFMVHLWLPKAHVEAPVAGSMILAGVLLKLGGFGLCRLMNLICMLMMKINSYMIGLCLMGMVYVGLMCCRLNDLKALVAYSSVAHMGLVICGVYSYYIWGVTGCLAMMISHGVSSSGLFCMVNMFYERSHSRSIYLNKGLILVSSIFTMMFFILCAANISAPPSINLLSEIFLMASVMSMDFMMVLIFPLGSFLGTVFTMYLFSYSQHGKSFFSMSSSVNSLFSEYITLVMHVIPLNMVILVSEFFFIL